MGDFHNLRFRWNDHISHLSRVFSEQRYDEQYCDTSLVTEDGYVIKAHRSILAMTSGYFARVLEHVDSTHHPIIVLNGTNLQELARLLDYIYQGRTQVDHHLMESVLDAADMLEIKGLSKIKNNLSIKKFISPTASVQSKEQPPLKLSKGDLKNSTEQTPNLKSDMDEIMEEKLKTDINPFEIVTQEELNIDLESEPDTTFNQREQEVSKQFTACDQVLGIDLSISRNISDERDTDHHSNEMFYYKKRKLGQENLPEELDASIPSVSTDFECEKAVEKDEETNTQPYRKHKIFGKSRSAGLPVKELELSNVKENSIHFTLEKLTTMFSKEKYPFSRTNYHSSRSNVYPNSKEGLPPAIAILPEKSSVDSEVEVSCDDGGFTVSVTTGPELESVANYKNGRRDDTGQVSFSLKKIKKRLRSKKDVEDAHRKWLASEKKHLISSIRRQPLRLSSRLKTVTEDETSIKLSINCDSSPTPEETKESDCEEKEESLMLMKEEKLGQPKRRLMERSGTLSARLLYTLPPPKEKEKQTRTSLTLTEKIKVIEAFLDGKSQRQIARMYGIGKTQVNGIVRKREEIMSLYHDNLDNGEKLTMKRQRRSEYASLNQHLIKWYRHMTMVASVKITTGMLRAKAMQIAPELGCHDFKGSNGWLATFKANNNLKFSKAKTKTKSDSSSKSNYDVNNAASNESEDQDLFEEGEEQQTDLEENNGVLANVETDASSSVSTIHHQRGEPHLDVGTTIQGTGATVINHSLSNSLLTAATAGSLTKAPPQMGNMSLGTNLAYNLSREHTRSEMQTRSDIHHLGEIHPTPSVVNPSSSILQKPDGPLSYKSEEYGYDPQGRMNEAPGGASRTSEYNYTTPYGFPSTYYGYHFLGQY